MTDLVRKLINQAKTVCNSVKSNPCDCEGCWLFDWNLEEGEDFECPMQKTIDELTATG